MTWFKTLMGFEEATPDQVRRNLVVEGATLRSKINGETYECGTLETPSLDELRRRVAQIEPAHGRTTLRQVVADVRELHADETNAGALFQVASQFNLLEMISPEVSPERGVAGYANDRTQGPACATAAGAGTIYRNYLAEVRGRVGQSEDNQIDCLEDLGVFLGNAGNRLWEMRNGYALPTRDGLVELSGRLRDTSEPERDAMRSRLRIGLQWNTQVTVSRYTHTVTQAFCSALPVAYCEHPVDLWADFATMILAASYEATLCAAVLNAAESGHRRVFLTLLGGGAFGNQTDWIVGAMRRAVSLVKDNALDITLVSYGAPSDEVTELVRQISAA